MAKMTKVEVGIFNEDKESEEAIRWILEKARDLFKDNKELILRNTMLCPHIKLQALTMTTILPSYILLTDSLVSMAMVFDSYDKFIEQQECERLIRYLVLYRKERGEESGGKRSKTKGGKET